MDEADDRRALADGSGAALDRAGADVAGGEDSRALVSSSPSAPTSGPVRMKPFSSRATVSPSQSVQGEAPRKRKRAVSGSSVPSVRVTASRCPFSPCEDFDFAAVADRDAVALKLVEHVVGHRLAEVGAAVQEGDQGATAGQPDGRLAS